MTIAGHVDYQRREYCRDITCPIQTLLDRESPGTDAYEAVRGICKNDCIHSTYEFHHWLIEKGFLVVRPET